MGLAQNIWVRIKITKNALFGTVLSPPDMTVARVAGAQKRLENVERLVCSAILYPSLLIHCVNFVV